MRFQPRGQAWGRVLKGIHATRKIPVIPALECGLGNAGLIRAHLVGKQDSLDQLDDLQLLGNVIPHSSSLSSASMLFAMVFSSVPETRLGKCLIASDETKDSTQSDSCIGYHVRW